MTPANQVPAVPRSQIVSTLAPLMFSLLGPQGSLRRLVLGAGAIVLVAMNKRWELGMDFNTCVLVLSSASAMVVASNVKEAANVRSANDATSAIQVAYHEAQAAIATANSGADVEDPTPVAQLASAPTSPAGPPVLPVDHPLQKQLDAATAAAAKVTP